jgi:hypothetical protein
VIIDFGFFSDLLESYWLQEAQILSQIWHWAPEDIWSRKLQTIETKQGGQSIHAKKACISRPAVN